MGGIFGNILSVLGGQMAMERGKASQALVNLGVSPSLQDFARTQGVEPGELAQFIQWRGRQAGKENEFGPYRGLHEDADGFLKDGDYQGHRVSACDAPQFKEVGGTWLPDQVSTLCSYLGVTEPLTCFLSAGAAEPGKVCFEANQPNRNEGVLDRVDGFMWSHGDCPFDWSHCEAIQDAAEEALGKKGFFQRIAEEFPGTLLTILGFGALGLTAWYLRNRPPPPPPPPGGGGWQPVNPREEPITNPRRLLPEHHEFSVDWSCLAAWTAVVTAVAGGVYYAARAARNAGLLERLALRSPVPGFARAGLAAAVAIATVFGSSEEAEAAEMPEDLKSVGAWRAMPPQTTSLPPIQPSVGDDILAVPDELLGGP